MQLAKAFGASRTPVREALRQLEAKVFARARPRRCAVVASIPPKQLAEMFHVIGELESACIRLAAASLTAADETALDELHSACRRAVDTGDVAAYRGANDDFHDRIYLCSRNGFLIELTQSVRRPVAPFRRVQFYGAGRLSRSFAEHERILQALKRGDGETAAREMRAHIQQVERSYETTYGGETLSPGQPALLVKPS